MTIDEFFDHIFEKNMELNLFGELSINDDIITWKYDALGKDVDDMKQHLEEIYEEDSDILNDFIVECKLEDYFYFESPEYDDTFVIFNIIEN
ncbi:MAG: hypothetical protein ACOC3V_00265 [bacterium]